MRDQKGIQNASLHYFSVMVSQITVNCTVEQIVKADSSENSKASHCWPCVRVINLIFLQKGPGMWKQSPMLWRLHAEQIYFRGYLNIKSCKKIVSSYQITCVKINNMLSSIIPYRNHYHKCLSVRYIVTTLRNSIKSAFIFSRKSLGLESGKSNFLHTLYNGYHFDVSNKHIFM